MAAEAPRGAIVVLCGLPAAGKSTLASAILRDGPGELLSHLAPRVAAVRVVHVSFDDVLARLIAQSSSGGFGPELWHEARGRIMGAVRSHFVKESGGAPAGSLAELCGGSGSVECHSGENRQPPFQVVVLDDNMQYRSMRR